MYKNCQHINEQQSSKLIFNRTPTTHMSFIWAPIIKNQGIYHIFLLNKTNNLRPLQAPKYENPQMCFLQIFQRVTTIEHTKANYTNGHYKCTKQLRPEHQISFPNFHKKRKKTKFSDKSSKLYQKKHSSSSKTLGKYVMEAQQTYNATLWMMKSFLSTTVGRRSLRKPTQIVGKSQQSHNTPVSMNVIEWE